MPIHHVNIQANVHRHETSWRSTTKNRGDRSRSFGSRLPELGLVRSVGSPCIYSLICGLGPRWGSRVYLLGRPGFRSLEIRSLPVFLATVAERKNFYEHVKRAAECISVGPRPAAVRSVYRSPNDRTFPFLRSRATLSRDSSRNDRASRSSPPTNFLILAMQTKF